uniref:Uncharacterized protein n=1 Tax=Chenopodium quinoa TaxID=63459 RepID=A0A803L3P6_CHEQI
MAIEGRCEAEEKEEKNANENVTEERGRGGNRLTKDEGLSKLIVPRATPLIAGMTVATAALAGRYGIQA